ncbi:DUF4097 family beta strand repeat-containing protein [uncultured Clostridium sp.]|jgi:hypothetical protein|uniref:DUF4097 family beta strand repeat-containing protein n=1 Tax=uncultured Clostridium sp. TaxID=59620 RepID=UPI00261409B4|nr:DUF4097 family beta strand repeat-containing protein [uncultured Clostridium sp.]
MKKFLIYGLATVMIAGLGVTFNSWEYKGDIKVREYDAPKEDKNEEFIEVEKKEGFGVELKEGQKLVIDMQNAKINLKHHDREDILINDVEGTTVIANKENEVSIIENLNAKEDKTFDYVTIYIPKLAKFDLEIKTNNSAIFGEINKLGNVDIESTKGTANLAINEVENINVETGLGNIDLKVKNILGSVTGNTGIGSVNFDIENEENINLKGYKVYSDKVIKIDQRDEKLKSVDIKGDLGKVIFN